MLRQQSWLDRTLNSVAAKVYDLIAIMCTRDFWAVFAVTAMMLGFMATAFYMLTNFSMMRMRNCFYASNMTTYLMFNTFLFFILGGMLALGELFNYLDNRKRGIPHKRGLIFWFLILTSILGTVELFMLKESCLTIS
jgi:hypothetical protein